MSGAADPRARRSAGIGSGGEGNPATRPGGEESADDARGPESPGIGRGPDAGGRPEPPAGPGRVGGETAPGLEPVRDLLASFAQADPDYSAQLTAYVRGRRVVDLWAGPHQGPDTLTGVFSSTKGVSALTLARLVEAGGLDLEAPVVRYWPEFSAHGKGSVSVAELLSHQAGVVGVPGTRIGERYDSRAIAASLAAMRPLWRPGRAFGYHGTAIGPLMEELFRRIAGEELQDHYAREVREPYGVDFFIGLPERLEPRYAPVLPPVDSDGPVGSEDTGAAAGPIGAQRVPDDLGSVVFFGAGPMDPDGVIEPNLRHLRAAGVASIGGVGSARGLARAYAAAVTGVDDREPFLAEETVERLGVEQCFGPDRVLGGIEASYAIVFQKPNHRAPFASWRAIGHDGAAGSLGYADPTYDLAFGYVRRRMAVPGGLDPRAIRLSACLRSLLDPVRPL